MAQKTIAGIYTERLAAQGYVFQNDIIDLMPVLREYASRVRHITEFGVRTGNSTCALLMGLMDGGGGDYIGYDICDTILELAWPKEVPGVNCRYITADTGSLPFIVETELLFVDSCHDHDHVTAELRHAPSVSRYILMHDTAQDWIKVGGRGPIGARNDFLAAHGDKWRMTLDLQYSNGLTVLERV
jgi:hypothetical protein